MKKLGSIILSLLTLTSLAFAAGKSGKGGIGDGGGDQITSEANPWRIGPAPIKFCIERADDFPQSKETLSLIVTEAFRNWQNFFLKHHMNENFLGYSNDLPKAGLPIYAYEDPTCNDPENQVRFEFGVMNAEIQSYLARYPERTIGFAHRTNYNIKTFQGGGVVWIAPHNSFQENTGPIETVFPDWTWTDSLAHQVLHEIGHVYGMPHNSTWVMDENVMFTQLWATLRYKNKINDQALLPLGLIETMSQVFDPLSGVSTISTCPAIGCHYSPPVPDQLLKVFKIQPTTMNRRVMMLKFSQAEAPNTTPWNEPPPPQFQLTLYPNGSPYKQTVDLVPQKLEYDFVPRLYLSGAYNPDIGYLKRVYNGTFTAVLRGEGLTLPLIVIVRNNFIKLSFFDSDSGVWVDGLTISPATVRDQNPAK